MFLTYFFFLLRPITQLDSPKYKEFEKNLIESQRKMRDGEINNWQKRVELKKTF